MSFRPEVTIGGRTFLVVELSEMGLRFQDDGAFEGGPGEQVEGLVHFSDGERAWLEEAVVLRRDESEVVLVFDGQVSLARMVAEQRRIVRTCLVTGNNADLEWLRTRVAALDEVIAKARPVR